MTAAVLVSGVSFVRNGRALLSDFDLEVQAGEHWAVIGPNGAGKSTLLSLIGALAHPTTGTVDILGSRLGRVDLQSLRRLIGHVNPRHPLGSPLGILDVVLTGLTGTIEVPMRWEPTAEQVRLAVEAIELVGLHEFESQRWNTMSQGERGRVLIARALVIEPQLLLFDEPSTGLDVAAREQLLHTIDSVRRRHPEVASLLVTHHLEELPESTTHALLIAHGRVVAAGEAHDVLTTGLVSDAFEHPIAVGFEDGRWSARSVRPQAPNRA